MDKKQFFESLISVLPDNSGHVLHSFEKIEEILTLLQKQLSDTSLKNEFAKILEEVLSRVWMLEQVCNQEAPEGEAENAALPLIIISVSGETIFANRKYCQLSGLTASEVCLHSQSGTLYDQVYQGEELSNARQAVSQLRAGKWYKHVELSMKHSGRRIAWSSYGWVGESLEIRSWREMYGDHDQEEERERIYKGYVMDTTKLLWKLHHISMHGSLSEEDNEKYIWVREFLSMFDFLWNHSGLFMEVIHVPVTKKKEISGHYNTVEAQFLKYSFQENKFQNIFLRAHMKSISDFLLKGNMPSGEYPFHEYRGSPIAQVSWHYCTYPHERAGNRTIFGVGTLTRSIPKKNIFLQCIQYIFKKHPITS